jgi:hypothetical protein
MAQEMIIKLTKTCIVSEERPFSSVTAEELHDVNDCEWDAVEFLSMELGHQ